MNDALTKLVRSAVENGSVDKGWLEQARTALETPVYLDVFSPSVGDYYVYLDDEAVGGAQFALVGDPGLVLLYARYEGWTLVLFRGRVELHKKQPGDKPLTTLELFDPVARIMGEREKPETERSYLGNYFFAPPDEGDSIEERKQFVDGIKDLLQQQSTDDAKDLLSKADEVFAGLLKDDQQT